METIMKKTLALLMLINFTSTFALTSKDFVGQYELTDGSEGCFTTFEIEEFERDEQSCLSFKRNSEGMNWSMTNKACNFNEATPVSVNDIPAPAFVGEIVIMKNSVLDYSSLYHSSTQTTQYSDGRTYVNKDELYLSFAVDERLVLEETVLNLDGPVVKEYSRRVCRFQRK